MDKVESKGQNQKKDGGKQSDKAPNPTGKKESKPENVKTGQKGDKPPLSQKNDTQTPRVPSTNQRRSNQTDKSQSILSSQPNRVGFFDHLPQKFSNTTSDTFESDDSIHPAIIKLGGLYKVGIIYDDDDRACALLMAFCNVIQDYTTPPKKSLSWELDRHIKAQVQYLVNCRPHSMAMGNIIKYLRFAISNLPHYISEADSKILLIGKLKLFLEERVLFAREHICNVCQSVIRDGDVILTLGSSAIIRQILLAMVSTKSFRLIVVDSMPLRDGIRTLNCISDVISCTYVPLAGAASAMKQATKVLVGASALLSNGNVLAPAGTGMIACLAKSRCVPVIFAAESYKFVDKVQLDAIVYNELGSFTELIRPETHQEKEAQARTTAMGGTSSSDDSNSAPSYVPQDSGGGYRGGAESYNLPNSAAVANSTDASSTSSTPTLPFQVINLRYDLTSIRHISVIATESGLIPPTSIPVLIRELRLDASGGNQSENIEY